MFTFSNSLGNNYLAYISTCTKIALENYNNIDQQFNKHGFR